jgi:tetratricopeptide (TPR) repeat protein
MPRAFPARARDHEASATLTNRYVRLALPIAVLGWSLTGASQQTGRSHRTKPQQAPASEAAPLAPLPHTEAVRDNNLGMALMDRHQFPEALAKFQAACVMNPDSDTGCLNMGIALLYMQQYDDAETVLSKSAERDPRSARAWFNLGLLENAAGKFDDARQDFEHVAALDPTDADTQYYLGYFASKEHQYEKAIAAFTSAIQVNPFLASAEDALADAEQHLGNAEGAKAHRERYQHIVSERLGKAVEFVYGEQGQYSLTQEMTEPQSPTPVPIPVHFIDVSSAAGLPSQPAVGSLIRSHVKRGKQRRAVNSTAPVVTAGPATDTLSHFLGSGACVFDYDGDGWPDIFLVDADGKGHPALYRNTGKGRFENVTEAIKLEFQGPGMGCAVGDYDNDGHPDLAVTSGNGIKLFHNEGNGTFKDVTAEGGLQSSDPGGGLALAVTFVDYDGDGDLDLYVTHFNDVALPNPRQPFSFAEDAAPPGNVLWRNDGNGKFEDLTRELGLRGSASSVGALATDINNDGAADFVLTGWQKFPSMLVNQREGAFRETSPWAVSMPGPAAGAVAFDFDGDGWMDLAFTHWVAPGLSIWRNIGGKSFQRLALVDPGWMRGWGIAALDYDNDGWVDLVAVGETFSGEGRILLLRNEGAAGFRDVTHETGLDKIELHDPRSVVALDFDGDGAPDLLVTQNDLPPVLLKNLAGKDNNWLKVALAGSADNAMGIGTRVEIFSGARRQVWEVPGASGYLSQGPSEVLAGLGTAGLADVVKLHWLTGVLQDEIQVNGAMRTPIAETQPNDPAPH